MDLIYQDGSTAAVGRAVTVVDATIETCAAWEFTKMTRERLKLHYDKGGLEREIVKLNNHSNLYFSAREFGVPGFAPGR